MTNASTSRRRRGCQRLPHADASQDDQQQADPDQDHLTRDAKRATLQRIAAPFELTAEDIRTLVLDPQIPAVVIRLRTT